MKQSSKSALLSALVFPGLGQLVFQKRPKRGLAFLIPALAAAGWMMLGIVQTTNTLLDEAMSGRLSPDPASIADRLHQTGATAGAETASWTLLICWLASLIDALFIRDKA